uniref:Chemotaxis protein CheA n=1 Tax=Magnetospirillum gryphiswaldense TaxID=55518 RepID=A4TV91_9PROT|nr:chemotaxis protein CheA [Magnetospirillum gryphiswaldense MSR-1]
MSDDQGYDLSQFKATYFEECAELLATAEETIARLQEGTGSDEDLNAVFRCVHSIKGGAGAFSFEALVHFAHVFETALDHLRSGKVEMSSHVADLMVRGNDILGDFVRAAQADTALPADHGADILAQLAALTGAAVPVSAKKPAAIASAPPPTARKTFIIHFQPQPDMLRTGHEPLLMLRETGGLGTNERGCRHHWLTHF